MLEQRVVHGFTHFDLELALAVAQVEAHQPGEWWSIDALDTAGLPTVFLRYVP